MSCCAESYLFALKNTKYVQKNECLQEEDTDVCVCVFISVGVC